MSETLLIWLFAGAFGGIIGLALWVYHHSRTCHGRPTPEQVAAAEAHQAAAEAKARAEGEALATLHRLDRELGHQTIEGSVLERMHRFSGRLRQVCERLGIDVPP